MHKLNLIQRSPEWKAFRNARVMASDAPIIMGLSPYSTPFELWQVKVGLVNEKTVNRAMQQGIDNEDVARRYFEKEQGMKYEPCVVVSDEYNWLGASLDGLSEDGESLVEIKCNGEKNHAIALEGKVPPDHFCQMQTQFLVTNLVHGYYYSWDVKSKTGVKIKVNFDATYCNNMFSKLKDFHRRIDTLEPPPLTDSDYKLMESDGWNALSDEYIALDREIKARQEAKEIIRKQLITMAGNVSCKGNGIKLQKLEVMGRICYEEIPEIKNIDLEKHRAPPSTQWRIYIME